VNDLVPNTPPRRSNWSDLSRSSGPIKGTRIDFKKGDYWINKTTNVSGKALLVLDYMQGWCRWQDGLPSYEMTEPGERHPRREDLGDLDEKLWTKSFGEPQDPWREVTLLYLQDPRTGEKFTLLTDTYSGRMGIKELAETIEGVQRAKPEALPIVALQAEMRRTKYGSDEPKTKLEILEWVYTNDGGSEPALAPTPQPPLPRGKMTIASGRRLPAANPIDDDIPF
jgi:hypothetical protein